MNFNFPLFLFSVCLPFILFSCKKEDDDGIDFIEEQIIPLNLTSSEPPFVLLNSDASFYKDISYKSNSDRTVFDVFIPKSATPTPLLLYIHGGGFIGGSKEIVYQKPEFRILVDSMLNRNIAVAAINYRLINPGNENRGIIKSLNDCRRSLQFMRYHYESLNIDKNQVILIGESAGAGASLWVGLNDEMSNFISLDRVARESTRVNAIVAIETQATYKINDWSEEIFSTYISLGFTQDRIIELLGQEYVDNIYGGPQLLVLNDINQNLYGNYFDFLKHMSFDDPEIYIENKAYPNGVPNSSTNLVHHPLHALTLKNRGDEVGVSIVAEIPEFNISSNETIYQFIARKVN